MKQQTKRKLKRVNWTMPEDVVDWLKIQSDKADMSISLYLTKLIEKDKKFSELTEKNS